MDRSVSCVSCYLGDSRHENICGIISGHIYACTNGPRDIVIADVLYDIYCHYSTQ
jgi:hypothetical protein